MQMLEMLLQPKAFTAALKPENVDKNRNSSMVPGKQSDDYIYLQIAFVVEVTRGFFPVSVDNQRLKLFSGVDENSNDYINAVHISVCNALVFIHSCVVYAK